MKRLLTQLLICMVSIISLSSSMAYSGGLDEISQSVVFLREPLPVLENVNGINMEVWLKHPGTNLFVQKTQVVTGTGFIIAVSNVCYLITAKHVAQKMTEQCEVVMRGKDTEPWRFKLDAITGQTGLNWIHHEKADVSIHPLPSVNSDGLKALERRAFPIEAIADPTHLPPRDAVLLVLGFPFGLGAEREFVPLSRDSKRSSGMLNDENGMYFLLQDPSISGYSGAPIVESGDPKVIAMGTTSVNVCVVSGGACCYGFVSGTFSDGTGGKMSKIIPAFYAVELIRKFQRESNIIRVQN